MTTNIRPIITRGLLSIIVGLFSLTSTLPISAYADCFPPDTSGQQGVHQPVGADASLYHYDCTNGLWVSSHFTFNPNTATYASTDPVSYTYNPTTGLYDSTVWYYSAPKNDYVSSVNSVTQPPAGASVIGGPTPVIASPKTAGAVNGSSSINATGNDSNNSISNSGNPGTSQTINTTGNNSNNNILGNNNNNLTANNANNISANNTLNEGVNTGDVNLLANTSAGNATSGNAQDVANVINLLQSTSNALGNGNLVTFVKNIDGNVNGDLLLDPSTLGTIQPASSPLNGNNNLTINNSTNASINNNINVNAASGNTTVDANTTAGNASSGNAQAIANVVNLINSAIGSGKSFIGTININGNLNGNIMVPPNFIDQLVASNVPTVTITNTGSGSNNSVNNSGTNNTNVTNTNNQGITNNVSGSANSGQVNVGENTTAGNAASGTAGNSVTAFNLTGSNVLGSNDLLVFVNVLGNWVGMIINAPQGATAAELGGGITANTSNTGANSNNAINNKTANNSTVNNSTDQQINNSIHTNANSGTVNANRNTKVGNVKSGNADTAVNLLNVENSTFSLSGWFGILFINVFGTWHGSFGISNAAKNTGGTFSSTGSDNSGSAVIPAPVQVFRFAPHNSTGTFTTGTNSGASNPVVAAAVLAARSVKSTAASSVQTPNNFQASSRANLWLPIAGVVLFVFYAIGDRIYSTRSSRKS